MTDRWADTPDEQPEDEDAFDPDRAIAQEPPMPRDTQWDRMTHNETVHDSGRKDWGQ